MSSIYGFRTACDIVAVFCLLYAILYYYMADGESAFRESFWYTVDAFETTKFDMIKFSPHSTPEKIVNLGVNRQTTV